MNSNIEVEKIGQIAIAISDLKKLVKFYRDILGLELLFEVPSGLAFFNCGGTRLMLTTLQGKEEDHNTSTIYYKVSDIHSARNHYEIKEQRLSVSLNLLPKWKIMTYGLVF
ncbi:VOC family protein [Pseudoalteromonas sp. NBT06-2]|uniref:VOC family protein n=1 Tax=Pseudoalteromonas sp. NBT06-2 TaxID=2025950 RepID=UPI001BB0CDBE|nr:VOC family protein [Pseudoalteromonas sp. NBT06-2]